MNLSAKQEHAEEAQRARAAAEREARRSEWGFMAFNDPVNFVHLVADRSPRQTLVHALARISSRPEMQQGWYNEPRSAIYRWIRGLEGVDLLRRLGAAAHRRWQAEQCTTSGHYQDWKLCSAADAAGGSAGAFIDDLIESGYFGHVGYVHDEERGSLHDQRIEPFACMDFLHSMLPFELSDLGPDPKMWCVLLPYDVDLGRYRVFTGEHLILSGEGKTRCLWVGDRTLDPSVHVLFDYLLERGGEDRESRTLEGLLCHVEDHFPIAR